MFLLKEPHEVLSSLEHFLVSVMVFLSSITAPTLHHSIYLMPARSIPNTQCRHKVYTYDICETIDSTKYSG